ncbi:hypothetical protein E4U17_007934 [Claviceps sp. LM77 group G4]|nr:hypothetical protein E4U17_007934 [Claviceps sp. LM77 group G4]KAG6079761.1 hypothetical protein E4U33_008149 [Claviceps sp. LM78 group G4]
MLSRWSRVAARDIGGGSWKGTLSATRTASRIISRAIQHGPKTQKYTARCAETRPRSDAGQSFRPRAMMMSSSAGQDDDVVETYVSDFDANLIRRHLMFDEFQDAVWGFVIYRCCNASDEDWERMLQKIRSELDDDSTKYYISQDLVPFHNLHPIDDPSLYGASIDQVRRHFRSWIPENIKSRLRPEATDLDDITYKHLVDMTPRYKYCLYVDDLCIESLDQDNFHCPVVKILDKTWEPPTPEEIRELEETEDLVVTGDGTTPAPFLDGLTNDLEEDVGWMYMPVGYYLERYFTLVKVDWHEQYVRPPYIEGLEDESNFIGHWRNK